MRKNLLSDSDFTKGWDNRFGTSIHLGFVSKLEVTEEHADVRVIFPDKVDHEGTPLITRPIPVLQVASEAKRQFAVPRIGTPVAVVKLPNGTSSYFVLGSFYTKRNPPPVTDPKLDYVIYDEGSIMQFDANDDKGELTWKLKGNVLWDNEKGATLKFKEAIVIESTEGDISIKAPTGTILLENDTIKLKGTLIFEGDIQHTGNMETSGVHHDSIGYHVGQAAREEDLLKRIEALEARVLALENLNRGSLS